MFTSYFDDNMESLFVSIYYIDSWVPKLFSVFNFARLLLVFHDAFYSWNKWFYILVASVVKYRSGLVEAVVENWFNLLAYGLLQGVWSDISEFPDILTTMNYFSFVLILSFSILVFGWGDQFSIQTNCY